LGETWEKAKQQQQNKGGGERRIIIKTGEGRGITYDDSKKRMP